jgi:hypothetical protein
MSLVPCSGWRGPPMCRGPLVSSAPPPSRTVTTPVKSGASPLQVGHRPSSAHPTCVAHVAKTHSPSRTFRGDFAGPGVRRTGSRTGRGRSAHHPVPDRERWVADAQVAWVVEVPRGTRRIRVTREEIRTRASRRGCPRPGLTDVGAHSDTDPGRRGHAGQTTGPRAGQFLSMTSMRSSQVSVMAKDLDEQVESFRKRLLGQVHDADRRRQSPRPCCRPV